MDVRYRNFLAPKVQNSLFVILIAALIWFGSAFDETLSEFGLSTPLTASILAQLQSLSWLSRILGFAVVLSTAFGLVQLNERHNVIRTQTFLPALFFVVLVGLTDNHSNVLNGGILSTVFMLFSVSESLSIDNERQTNKVFNVFVLLSLASFFHFPLIVLVPFWWVAFGIMRLANLRTIAASLIGLVVPYVFAVPAYLYFFDETGTLDGFLQTRFLPFHWEEYNWFEGVYLLTLVLVLLVSLVSFIFSYQRENMRARRAISSFYVLLVGSIVAMWLNGAAFRDLFPVSALFLSLLYAHYFSLNYNRFSKIVMGIFGFVCIIFFFADVI